MNVSKITLKNLINESELNEICGLQFMRSDGTIIMINYKIFKIINILHFIYMSYLTVINSSIDEFILDPYNEKYNISF